MRTALSAAQKRGKRGLSPSPYFYADKYLGPLKSWLRASRSRGGIDWSKTQAFSEGKEGDIFVNLKGRDPHGVVEPGAAYEAVRNRIIKRLQRLADPATGERAVERVYTREEQYDGPWVPWAPDLMIYWRNTSYMPIEEDGDCISVFVPRMREHMDWPTTGNHRMDGMLFAVGPAIGF